MNSGNYFAAAVILSVIGIPSLLISYIQNWNSRTENNHYFT